MKFLNALFKISKVRLLLQQHNHHARPFPSGMIVELLLTLHKFNLCVDMLLVCAIESIDKLSQLQLRSNEEGSEMGKSLLEISASKESAEVSPSILVMKEKKT